MATTTGGTEKQYRSGGGSNWFTVSELLRPIQRTLTKCNGTYLPAFISYNANEGTEDYFEQEAKRYEKHIKTSLSLLAN